MCLAVYNITVCNILYRSIFFKKISSKKLILSAAYKNKPRKESFCSLSGGIIQLLPEQLLFAEQFAVDVFAGSLACRIERGNEEESDEGRKEHS